ncbi:MAG: ABC transporter ATP-binding protein [Pseudomonadota bacterium]
MTLAIQDLSFSYPRKPVLADVNAGPLPRGAVTALIGPNAAGKSTLFRCIGGLLPRYTGSIALDGAPLEALAPRERVRKVTFMPQFFAANAALSVFDVVLLARKSLSGWAVDAADTHAVAAVLDNFGIGHLSEADIGELSGGQQQMVSVCQALVREPDVFLFDEPTSALDLKHQLEIMTAIARESRRRNAVTMVALHDLNLAARFADHAVLMRAGAVAADGLPEAVLADTALGETYGVAIDLITHERAGLHVSASLR